MVLKLPARKFSTREREMLFGAGAPTSYFYDGGSGWPVFGAGFGVAVAAVVFLGLQTQRAKEDDDRKKKDAASVRPRPCLPVVLRYLLCSPSLSVTAP